MKTEQMQEIVSAAAALAEQKRCPVIGLDGLGGAGKSTISEKLCDAFAQSGLHTVLLHIDDFIHVRAVRYNPDVPDWKCYYHLQWRYGAFCALLDRIRSGEASEAELYDKENDCYYCQPLEIRPQTVILTEGIFLQREELHGVFDYMIYLDVPEQERLNRVLKRDLYIGSAAEISAKYEKRYFPAERFYFSEYRPDLSADMVITE